MINIALFAMRSFCRNNQLFVRLHHLYINVCVCVLFWKDWIRIRSKNNLIRAQQIYWTDDKTFNKIKCSFLLVFKRSFINFVHEKGKSFWVLRWMIQYKHMLAMILFYFRMWQLQSSFRCILYYDFIIILIIIICCCCSFSFSKLSKAIKWLTWAACAFDEFIERKSKLFLLSFVSFDW